MLAPWPRKPHIAGSLKRRAWLPASFQLSDTLIAALASRYTLERELGRGGMATVYLAHDVKHQRLVALKVLLPELAATVGSERFLREIHVTARLEHPHILPVLDSGETEGLLWYTMPYVRGENLRERLRREVQLPVEEAVDLTRQIASALQYAHREGVVHRDIKPENILLSAGQARVADFGIARALVSTPADRLTGVGFNIGTPDYMSPEQATGGGDTRSDIYSLGCVLYEMLTGDPPFRGASAQAIMARHLAHPAPHVRAVRPSVSAALDAAIQRAMAKDPADRFTTVAEFVQAMTAPHGRSTAPENRSRSGRRVRIVSLAFGLLVVAGAGALWRFRSQSSEADSQLASERLVPQRLAVLFLRDRTPARELGYLARGLTEALIDSLRRVPGLDLIPSAGVEPFRVRTSTDSIARVLGVGTLVDGDLEKVGGKIRASVWLVDGPSGVATPRRTLEGTPADIINIQADLARSVVRLLREKPTNRASAWILVQQAAEVEHEADGTGDGPPLAERLLRADSVLARAEAADSHWEVPVARRALLAYRQARVSLATGGAITDVDGFIGRGTAFAEKAVVLAPHNPNALEARGSLRYLRYLLNLAADSTEAARLLSEAEQDLRAAVASNPSQASAWNTLSHLLIVTGLASEGRSAASKAYAADPYRLDANRTIWRLFQVSLDYKDAQQAKRWCDEGKRRFPSDYRFVECRLWLLTLPDQQPSPTAAAIWKAHDAFLEADKANRPEIAKWKGLMLAAVALLRAGLPDSALSVIGRASGHEHLDPSGDLTYLEAMARSQLGDKDKAISLLSRYFAAHPQQLTFANRDDSFWWLPLQGEPSYRALVGPAK